uniref:Oligoendopeptidase F n=1 Tax=uncultured Helicobacter sp. TaxID=175537 RepID=A0A650EMD0_9HELI|nr:oligoendopeptidase F [uncultured Helicobacter sp.]
MRKVAVMQNEWDLGALFKTQESLDRFISANTRRAKHFAKTYEGKLHTFKPKDFGVILREYEAILEGFGRVMTYAFLRFAKDTTQGDFYAKYENLTNQSQNLILFFELEFCKLNEKKREDIIKNEPHYEFYLQKLIENDQYQLSLPEEKVLLTTSLVGVGAFSRLFDEHLAQMRFKAVKEDSKHKSEKAKSKAYISEEEILSLLHHSKRSVRKQAQESFSKGLKKSRHLLGYILNMVRKDCMINMKMRGYKSPESFRHIQNQATQKSVDKLIEVVNEHFGMVSEYYNIKRDLLGLKKLKDYDRYAPLDTKPQNLPYNEAINMVLQAFGDFDQCFKDIALKGLRKGWVDSHPADYKRGGAFSHGSVPSAHPYVLLNYTHSRRDAFTIAHEFGHMIHQELSKKQGYLNMDTPLTTAETASVFAEMLLFDKMKKTLEKDELIALYAGKLEDIYSTMFRQVVMTNFERRIHSTEEELKPEAFDRIWKEENERMFGDSLQLTKNYEGWWCYIPHFIHSPFYCYAYSYGQLLVLALFGLYKSQKTQRSKQKFIDTYVEFLALGGSKSPKELIRKFGFNVESDKFWLIGIAEVRKMLEEFKEIVNEQNSYTSKT